MARICVTI